MLKWIFTEAMIGITAINCMIIGGEIATAERKAETFTITGRSGPELYGAQWVLETDKGPLALSGLTYYVDDKEGAGADLINAFKVGTTYCMHVQNDGRPFDVLEEYVFGDGQKRPEWMVYGGKTQTGPTCALP